MCYFGFGDKGEEKKICNSQCFYFHVCDIENFGENFPLNSEIGRNYSRKLPKKHFIVKKTKFIF